jgi:hypothetical protein
MFLMSLACCAAIFGSVEVTLCGISIWGVWALPFGIGPGDRVGAAGATPFVAKLSVSKY